MLHDYIAGYSRCRIIHDCLAGYLVDYIKNCKKCIVMDYLAQNHRLPRPIILGLAYISYSHYSDSIFRVIYRTIRDRQI